MASSTSLPRAVSADSCETSRCTYSICTLVSEAREYEQMRKTFAAADFTDGCEFLFLDNTKGNRFDAYQGINLFLRAARGTYVVLCHQDVHPIDRRERLDSALAEVEQLDPDWGLAGNAGGQGPGRHAIRITDANGVDTRRGSFPARVHSLDENFIVVRADAGLAVSHDLTGFHLYGTDLCLIADVLGWNAYVIDFHVRHGGAAKKAVPREFDIARDLLFRKYARAFAARRIQAPCTALYISGSRVASVLRNRWTLNAILERVRRSWYRRLHRT